MKYISLLLALLIFYPHAIQSQDGAGSSKQPPKKSVDMALAEFCMKAEVQYELIEKWIKENKKKPPEIPQPFAVDPSCHDCSDPSAEKTLQKQIDAWKEKIAEPESKMLNTLLNLEKDWTNLKDFATPELSKCFDHYSQQGFSEMVKALADKSYEKALAFAKKYNKIPQYARAGIDYVLSTTHDYALLTGATGDIPFEAGVWMQTCMDEFDKRLVKNYQYQIFPAYTSMVREIALLGGDIMQFDDYLYQLNKYISFMHFKLKIDFEASGHGDNGAKYHALVKGETEVRCRLDNGCYTWEPMDRNEMQFNIVEVNFSSDQGAAVYNGTKSFTAPVTIKVNMCADDPKFKISFGKFGPDEETYSTTDGAQFQSPLMYSLAVATLGSANLEKMKSQANAAKEKAGKVQGDPAKVDAAAKRLQQHKNDPNYLNTPEGKADMALMQQTARDLGYDPNQRPDAKRMQNVENLKAMNAEQQKINAKFRTPGYIGSGEYQQDQAELARLKGNVNMNDFSNAIGIDMNLLTIELPFTIGVKEPVDKIKKDKINEIAGSKGGWEFGQFHVVLENAPDKADEIKLPGGN